MSTPEDPKLAHARRLMCSKAGRAYVERVVLRPFGFIAVPEDVTDEMVEQATRELVKAHDWVGSDEAAGLVVEDILAAALRDASRERPS